MSADDNKNLIRVFVDCFNRSDWNGLRNICAEGFHWVMPTVGILQSDMLAGQVNVVGPKSQNIEESILAMQAAHDASVNGDFTIRIISIVAEGERASAELEGSAVNKANGRKYTNKYMYALDFKDGKIVEFREYQDTLHTFDVWGAA